MLLRSVTGYMAAPRPVAVANLSRYDRILVLPTAAVARVPVTTAPAPVFQQPRPAAASSPDERRTAEHRAAAAWPAVPDVPVAAAWLQPGGRRRQQVRSNRLAVDRGHDGAARPGATASAPSPRRDAAARDGGSRTGPAGPGLANRVSRPARGLISVLMAFIDELNTAIADAMRSQDQIRLVALRMLKAALVNREIDRGRPLDDGEARQVVGSLVKQRKDSIEQFTKGGRQDLADKEAAEIRVLESYLPPSADPAVVERAVVEAIAETGATSPKDMGRVMKAAMAKLAGQSVDGKTVNELVRQKLAGV